MSNGVSFVKNKLIGAIARNKAKGVRQMFINEWVSQANAGGSAYVTRAIESLELEGEVKTTGLKVIFK